MNNTQKPSEEWGIHFNEEFRCGCPDEPEHYFFDKDGLDVKKFIREAIQATREETIKMLWSIHTNENDKESEAWNKSLDLAIFRLTNPDVLDSFKAQKKGIRR